MLCRNNRHYRFPFVCRKEQRLLNADTVGSTAGTEWHNPQAETITPGGESVRSRCFLILLLMTCCLVLTIPGYTSLSRARWLGAMVRLPLLVSSFHFKMASMRSEKSICALPRLSEVSPTLL